MTTDRLLRIVIADDQCIVREGLKNLIDGQPDIRVVAEARDWPEASKQVLCHRPDVCLADLHMPGGEAAAAISAVRKRFPGAKIVMLANFVAGEEIYQVLRAGARGFVPKREAGREELLECIRAVSEGRMWVHPTAAAKLIERMQEPALTRREKQILHLMVLGQSNKEIGSSLNVTEGTVKVHLSHLFGKLGVSGRVAAVGAAIRRGFVSLSEPREVSVEPLKHRRIA